ncbi:MAG: Nitrilase/cyanide hydratase and apolipoprotein N-acyltransferase [Acidimicrobiia bacterium]|nr:Nitrilase/cyanide hydratase and apolipoprotein N-acyltransferase [Acidimicrobiia bacterium]
MKVAAIQHDVAWRDPARTHELVTPMIEAAAFQGARLILLTEMFATGFSLEADDIAQAPDGPSTRFLQEQAAKHQAWVGGSIALRWPATSARPRNVFTLAAPDGTLSRYAKLHPFSYGREHEIYDAGDDLITVAIDGVRVTPFVCYDLRFANVFWNKAHDTDLFTVVANWPQSRREHWSALLRARAIENQAYVVGVNRIGHADKLDYSGDSAIIDPLGAVLTTAQTTPAVLVADVQAEQVQAVRTRFPFLTDRREFPL